MAMIEALEARGQDLAGRGILVEPTSGNTGIALAFVARRAGLPADPDHARIDVDRAAQDAGPAGRRAGADPAREGHERRHRQGAGDPGATIPARSCRSSSTTPPTRTSTAGPPPRRSGTTPTARSTSSSPASAPAARITGVGQVLKPRKPCVQMIAVEPEAQPGAVGRPARPAQDPGHRRGLRARRSSTASVIDEIVKVSNDDRFAHRPRAWPRVEGHPGRHLLRRGARRRRSTSARRPEMRRQADRRHHPSFAERYLSDGAVRGAMRATSSPRRAPRRSRAARSG